MKEFNENKNPLHNEQNSEHKIKKVENDIHNAITQGTEAKRGYLANRITDIRRQQETFLGKIFMSEGDKQILKTLEKAENKQLETLAENEHNLLKVHCNALIEHSKSFHKALYDAFNSSLVTGKSRIIIENKLALLTEMDKRNGDFEELYINHRKRIDNAPKGLKPSFEKLEEKYVESFMNVQEKLMNEFSEGLDKVF